MFTAIENWQCQLSCFKIGGENEFKPRPQREILGPLSQPPSVSLSLLFSCFLFPPVLSN